MKKQKKDEKTLAAPKEQSKKGGRREFLERTGLTAGGVLMTTLAAGGISKGQTLSTTQQRLLSSDVFKQLFDSALTDKEFQDDILAKGFKALNVPASQIQAIVGKQQILDKRFSAVVASKWLGLSAAAKNIQWMIYDPR